jgi:hypothetical protein
MIGDYDWEEILKFIQNFAKVEDIQDIIIVGVDNGIRRIKIGDTNGT